VPFKSKDDKRASDRRSAARRRARLREHRRLTVRQWHQRQLGPHHDWHPAMSVSLEQWRQRSRLWLIAERDGRFMPLTDADLVDMTANAETGLAELHGQQQR
jgi:aromatic ring-cleaving dioxygenase